MHSTKNKLNVITSQQKDKQTLGYMENLKKYLKKRVLLMIKNK